MKYNQEDARFQKGIFMLLLKMYNANNIAAKLSPTLLYKQSTFFYNRPLFLQGFFISSFNNRFLKPVITVRMPSLFLLHRATLLVQLIRPFHGYRTFFNLDIAARIDFKAKRTI